MTVHFGELDQVLDGPDGTIERAWQYGFDYFADVVSTIVERSCV
jgi:hypothetical protein